MAWWLFASEYSYSCFDHVVIRYVSQGEEGHYMFVVEEGSLEIIIDNEVRRAPTLSVHASRHL